MITVVLTGFSGLHAPRKLLRVTPSEGMCHEIHVSDINAGVGPWAEEKAHLVARYLAADGQIMGHHGVSFLVFSNI